MPIQSGELIAPFANEPGTILDNILNNQLLDSRGKQLEPIILKRFGVESFFQGNIRRDTRQVLEEFARPIDITGMPQSEDRDALSSLQGNQTLAIACAYELTHVYDRLGDFLHDKANVAVLRSILDKTLRNDIAYLEHRAFDAENTEEDLEQIARYQHEADILRVFHQQLTSRVKRSTDAPTLNS